MRFSYPIPSLTSVSETYKQKVHYPISFPLFFILSVILYILILAGCKGNTFLLVLAMIMAHFYVNINLQRGGDSHNHLCHSLFSLNYHLSSSSHKLRVVELLLENGANPDIQEEFKLVENPDDGGIIFSLREIHCECDFFTITLLYASTPSTSLFPL